MINCKLFIALLELARQSSFASRYHGAELVPWELMGVGMRNEPSSMMKGFSVLKEVLQH